MVRVDIGADPGMDLRRHHDLFDDILAIVAVILRLIGRGGDHHHLKRAGRVAGFAADDIETGHIRGEPVHIGFGIGAVQR